MSSSLVVIPLHAKDTWALHGWMEVDGLHMHIDYIVRCDHKPEPVMSVEPVWTQAWAWQERHLIGYQATVTIDNRVVVSKIATLPHHYRNWHEPSRWEEIVDRWHRLKK